MKIQFNIYIVSLTTLLLSMFFNYLAFKFKNLFIFKKKQSSINRFSKTNTPPIGGIATSLSFLISVRLLGETDSIFLLIGSFGIMIAILGTLDDFFDLNWKTKLLFQATFVTIPILSTNLFLNFESLINLDLSNKLNYLVTITWIILIINVINFIDNMDGLAVIVSSSILVQSILLTYYFNQNNLTDLSILLLFAIIGFFIFNFPPAKLYLGDSGSLFIGFCLGFLSILFIWNPGSTKILFFNLSPLLLFFTIPLLDFLVIMKHRFDKKVPFTTGGTDHISHRLINKGFNEKEVLLIFFIYSFYNFFFVVILLNLTSLFRFIILIIYILQLLYLYRYLLKLEVIR